MNKGSKILALFLLCLSSLHFNFLQAQQPEQDCLFAIPVCNENVYTQTNSYVGEGLLPTEISASISCLSSGEKNGVWYKIIIPNNGNLKFLITPVDLFDDYDWAVYNLTNASCGDIASNSALQVSCNYSGDWGTTGPNGMSNETSQDGGGTPYNATIPVQAGETYYIYVSNYSSTQSGYTIDFTGSPTPFCSEAGTIFAALAPGNTCAINTIKVTFSQPILCNSIQASDFKFTSPTNAVIPVTGIQAQDCDNIPASSVYYLTLGQTLTQSGVYTLNLVNTIVSQSGQSYATDVIQQIIQPEPSTLRFFTTFRKTYVCADCSNGKIVFSGIGGLPPYSYSIDNGQTFQPQGTFDNLGPGTYSLVIKDSAGCTVVRSLSLGN